RDGTGLNPLVSPEGRFVRPGGMFVSPRAEKVFDPAGKFVSPGRNMIPDGLVAPGPCGIGGVPGTGDGRLISPGALGVVGGGLRVLGCATPGVAGCATPGDPLGGVAGAVCADKDAQNKQHSRDTSRTALGFIIYL